MNFNKLFLLFLFIFSFINAMDPSLQNFLVTGQQHGFSRTQSLHQEAALSFQQARQEAALHAWHQQEAIKLSVLEKFKQARTFLAQKNNEQAKSCAQEGFTLLANVPPALKKQWLPFLGHKDNWTVIFDLDLQSEHLKFIASIAPRAVMEQKNPASLKPEKPKVPIKFHTASLQKLPELKLQKATKVVLPAHQANLVKLVIPAPAQRPIISTVVHQEIPKPQEAQLITLPTPAEKQLKKLIEEIPAKNPYQYSLESNRLFDQAWNQIDEKEHKRLLKLSHTTRQVEEKERKRLLKLSYANRAKKLQNAYNEGQKDLETTRELAHLYLNGKSKLKNKKAVKRGLQLLEKCAQECSQSRLELAYLLFLEKTPGGLSVQKNAKQATELLMHESLYDNGEALYLLGKIYAKTVDGDFKNIDQAKAVQVLFKKAVDLGWDAAQNDLKKINDIVKNFKVAENLFCRLSLLKVDNKGENQQIQSLLDIFKEGLKHGCESVCEQAVKVLGTIKSPNNQLDKQVKVVQRLFVELDTTETKRFALDAAQLCITKLRKRVVDEIIRGRENFPKGSKEEHQLACDRFNTKVALSMMENKIVPLVKERITSDSDNVLAHHFTYAWLHAKLFHTIGNKADQTKWLKEAEKFARKLLESNKNGIHQLAGSFLHTLGTIYEKNSEKSNACFKKAWKECNYYEAGKIYARGLFNRAKEIYRKNSHSKFAEKYWKEAVDIFKACADPEKGNDADVQSILATHYGHPFGKKVPLGYKSLPKDLKKAKYYAQLAADQGDGHGHKSLGLIFEEEENNKQALHHFVEAMKLDQIHWDLLLPALRLKNMIDPENETIKKCHAFREGIQPKKNKKNELNMPFVGNVRKNLLPMIREANLNEDGTFKEPLAAFTVRLCIKNLCDLQEGIEASLAKSGVVTLTPLMMKEGLVEVKMMYPFLFSKGERTFFQRLELAKKAIINQRRALTKVILDRNIKLVKPTKSAPVETPLAPNPTARPSATGSTSTENRDSGKAAQVAQAIVINLVANELIKSGAVQTGGSK